MTAAPVLVADVGGTNTRLALCHGAHVDTATLRRFANSEHENLAGVLRAYRSEFTEPLSAACAAIAGPVQQGVGRLTNRDWEIAPNTLCDATGAAEAHVINDLEAQGHALDHVAGHAICGPVPPGYGTRLVVGVGTGFNAAPVHHTAAGSHVAVSEAGHASLPVWNAETRALSEAIAADHGFAAIEEALSGRGLLRVHAHLAGVPVGSVDGAQILARAREMPDSVEGRATVLMSEILGCVVGDLALIHLPEGGVFLVGGVARALHPWLFGPAFARGFTGKGRFSGFMARFPVALVEDDYAALTGCAGYVAQRA